MLLLVHDVQKNERCTWWHVWQAGFSLRIVMYNGLQVRDECCDVGCTDKLAQSRKHTDKAGTEAGKDPCTNCCFV